MIAFEFGLAEGDLHDTVAITSGAAVSVWHDDRLCLGLPSVAPATSSYPAVFCAS